MGQRYAPPRPKGSAYITEQGAKRLADELTHLLYTERPRVTRGVAEAAAEGDRSENAEYIYGKKRLREIDKKIEFLTKRLEVLSVVAAHDVRGDGRVVFGATVLVEDDEGDQHTFRVVGPDESDPTVGDISMDSPVGRALLGKRAGDECRVARPKGDVTFSVLDVRYPG